MIAPVVVPWASQYFASGMQEGPDAVLEAMGSPSAARVGVPSLAAALAGTADAVAAAERASVRAARRVHPRARLPRRRAAPRSGAVFIWVDSHGDLNTPATSHSGFIGGMPFAVIVGWWGAEHRAACGLAPSTSSAQRSSGRATSTRARRRCWTARGSSRPRASPGRSPGCPRRPIVMHVDGDVLDPCWRRASTCPRPAAGMSRACGMRCPPSLRRDASSRSASAAATRAATATAGAHAPTSQGWSPLPAELQRPRSERIGRAVRGGRAGCPRARQPDRPSPLGGPARQLEHARVSASRSPAARGRPSRGCRSRRPAPRRSPSATAVTIAAVQAPMPGSDTSAFLASAGVRCANRSRPPPCGGAGMVLARPASISKSWKLCTARRRAARVGRQPQIRVAGRAFRHPAHEAAP